MVDKLQLLPNLEDIFTGLICCLPLIAVGLIGLRFFLERIFKPIPVQTQDLGIYYPPKE